VALPGLPTGLEPVGFERLAARLADPGLPERFLADGRTREVRRADFGFGFPFDRPLRRLVGFLEWTLDLDRTAMMDDAERVHPESSERRLFGQCRARPGNWGRGTAFPFRCGLPR
jgi:hypothetical protein